MPRPLRRERRALPATVNVHPPFDVLKVVSCRQLHPTTHHVPETHPAPLLLHSIPRRAARSCRGAAAAVASFASVALAAAAAVGSLAPAVVAAQNVAQSAAPTASGGDSLRLSLADAVQRALRTSDEARLAKAQVDVAEAQVLTARSSALPQLRLNGTYTHQIENARAQAVGQIFNQPNTYNVNASHAQSFFQGGREYASMRAASRLRSSARLSADEARAQVALDVQRAYVQALFARRVLEIQTQNLALAGERLAQVQQLEAGGRASRYDVLRARVERSNL